MHENIEPDYRFEVRDSDDPAKTDKELVCTNCDAVICDVEHGDNLWTLVTTAAPHICPDKES